jgi:hypothetical protein
LYESGQVERSYTSFSGVLIRSMPVNRNGFSFANPAFSPVNQGLRLPVGSRFGNQGGASGVFGLPQGTFLDDNDAQAFPRTFEHQHHHRHLNPASSNENFVVKEQRRPVFQHEEDAEEGDELGQERQRDDVDDDDEVDAVLIKGGNLDTVVPIRSKSYRSSFKKQYGIYKHIPFARNVSTVQ